MKLEHHLGELVQNGYTILPAALSPPAVESTRRAWTIGWTMPAAGENNPVE